VTAALLAFVAVVLAGLGARDQLLLAGLNARRAGSMVWIVALATSVATAWIAAQAAVAVGPVLRGNARPIFAGLALAIAGLECLVIVGRRTPAEPTRSVAAAAIVLLAHQIADGARFLIFAIAVGANAPTAAALGGALGGAVSVTAGWIAGEALPLNRLRATRRIIGGLLVLAALLIGVQGIVR
jgi:hypothetical protein